MLGSDFLRHHWPTITISLTAAAIACLAIMMLFSMPPHRIVMATGPEGDAYYEIGRRYRAALMGKLAILLVPTLGVLYPMTRFLPRIYDWVMRSKVLRMYGE